MSGRMGWKRNTIETIASDWSNYKPSTGILEVKCEHHRREDYEYWFADD